MVSEFYLRLVANTDEEMMVKRIVLLWAVTIALVANAQRVEKYWVSFADKAVPMEYRLDNPSAYLGPRALERRVRQRIAVDSLDLPVCPQYVAALEHAGMRVQNRSKWLNGVSAYVPEGTDVSFLDTMRCVAGYQLLEVGESRVPDINSFLPVINTAHREDYMAYGRSYYNNAYAQIKQLNGIQLHRNGYEGQGVIVGVCDGGFPGVDTITAFARMRDEGRLLAVRDFVWEGDSVFSVHDHGTVVLSTMASYDPGMYVGTAPMASYILCRTENTTQETPLEEYNWVAAAEYLDSMGADIVTSSLGYYYFDNSMFDHALAGLDGRTYVMSIGADIAVSRGMLVINAAGNDGQSNPQHLNSPADVERVLTVGACDRDGNWASFSSYGPTADLRIKPDVLALGSSVQCIGAPGVVHATSGTSLATPILAGMMACLMQQSPDLTPQQLCDSVRAWGHLANAPNVHEGYGIPDFGKALQRTDPVGIASPAEMFAMYPNPAHDRLVVAGVEQGLVTVRDLTGRVVKHVQCSGEVEIGGLVSGVYFVTVTSSAGCATQRLVVE